MLTTNTAPLHNRHLSACVQGRKTVREKTDQQVVDLEFIE